MAQGTIKFFNDEKGFGFIEVKGSKDIFVHAKGCGGYIPSKGDQVEFEIEESKKGPVAVDVQKM